MEIIYQDEYFIVVNKKCSQLVQADKSGSENLLDELQKQFPDKQINVPQRLDRQASGIQLFTLNEESCSKFNVLFRDKKIKKTYWAILEKEPTLESDKIENYIIKNEKLNKSFISSKEDRRAQHALLEYKKTGKSDRYFFVEVNLITGRHHQIRCQFSQIGCPIKGDIKYGAKRTNKNSGIYLHAFKLEFIHPFTNQLIKIETFPADDILWNLFKNSLL